LFANLFFLILNLLLISSVIDQTTFPFFIHTPGQAFALFLFSYAFFLWLLYRQSAWLLKCDYRKEKIILIANLELLLFLSSFYFLTGSHRWIIANPFGVTSLGFASLTLYFTGLFVCHYAIEKAKNTSTIALNNAWLSICFLLPFIIPFLILAFLNEASSLTGLDHVFADHLFAQTTLFASLNLAFIVLTIILLPPLAVRIWQCPKMNDPDLDDFCRQANFKHAGFRIWKILNNSMTAAIIGIIAKLRYILFTQKLLDKVPKRCITAILAHEIGHSYHKHLFFYPFILMGMIVIASLTPLLIYIPREDSSTLFSLLSFIFFGLTMAIYFRFVFGYFSRIFERQADLHIFKLNLPAHDMTDALDQLAVAAGNIHLEPNWHHYSIQQRIDFINQADHDRSLISRHDRLVRFSLAIYFAILCLLVVIFILTLF
jgi:Zn-dependent protease with chaperone function